MKAGKVRRVRVIGVRDGPWSGADQQGGGDEQGRALTGHAPIIASLAAKGRDLALCARRTERLDELKAELSQRHPGITVAISALDVNDREQVPKVSAGAHHWTPESCPEGRGVRSVAVLP